MNIAEILKKQASLSPEGVALIEHCRGTDRQCSFSELEEQSVKAATLLSQQGLKPGDAVLVFLPVSIDLYVALIAIFRLGLVAMFLDPSAGRAHITRCCNLHPPKGFIGTPKSHLLRLLSPALRRIPCKFVVGMYTPGAINWREVGELTAGDNSAACIVARNVDDPALITFTSGSTGQPKGAVRSHGFLIAQHKALETSLALKPGQIDLSTLPIFVLANLASGVTSLIPDTDLRRPGAIDAKKVMQQISHYKPVRAAASPAFYECLIRYCHQHDCTLDTFEQIYTGGAPVFPKLLAELQKLTPQAEVIAVYGSTEAEPIAHIAYTEITADDIQAMMSGKGLLTGTPVSCISLQIIKMHWGEVLGPFDETSFNTVIIEAGGVGEIVVSGEHVLQGYLNGVGDEDTKFNVGTQRWHRTGDAGYLDSKGRLWLMGRCGALISDEKGHLYPFAVESAAINILGVARVALIQCRGRRLLMVQEETKNSCTTAELLNALAWAQLDEIKIIETIPMDKRHNAKVDYTALAKLLDE